MAATIKPVPSPQIASHFCRSVGNRSCLPRVVLNAAPRRVPSPQRKPGSHGPKRPCPALGATLRAGALVTRGPTTLDGTKKSGNEDRRLPDRLWEMSGMGNEGNKSGSLWSIRVQRLLERAEECERHAASVGKDAKQAYKDAAEQWRVLAEQIRRIEHILSGRQLTCGPAPFWPSMKSRGRAGKPAALGRRGQR